MTSQKVKDRLKALRRKFHLGEFRKNKKHRRTSHKKTKNRERVFMARRRRHTFHSKKRSHRGSRSGFGLAGLNIMELAMMGAGAGFAGTTGALVSKYTGGKLSGNAAQAVAGIGIYFIGKKVGSFSKFTTPLAKGILIKTVGDMVEDHVVPMVAGYVGTTTTATTSTNGATFV